MSKKPSAPDRNEKFRAAAENLQRIERMIAPYKREESPGWESTAGKWRDGRNPGGLQVEMPAAAADQTGPDPTARSPH
jgi:hypothetical protein